MAQYSVLITVLVASVLIAHTLCFRVEGEPSPIEPIKIEAKQVVESVVALAAPTTQAPLPSRIRDTVVNTIRDFGNNIRQAPTRVQECFQNITKCANTILRRNQTTNAVQNLVNEED